MYFDAVLNFEHRVLFNETTEATKKWLNENKEFDRFNDWIVIEGILLETMSVEDYLSRK